MANKTVVGRIHRLSYNQLKVLGLLCRNKSGLLSSSASSSDLGLKGKSLGGVFSSLSRQVIGGKALVMPFGRGREGRGLRWKLNTDLILVKELKIVVSEILKFGEEGL